MRNLFYTMALLLAATSVPAQSLWRDGSFNGASGTYSAGQQGTMDYWPETPNGQVLGWYGAVSGSTGSSISIEEAEGRNFASNSSDKSAKITVDWKSGATWHITFRSLSYTGEQSRVDFNPFELTAGSTFYYSFWAKTDAAGYPANKLFPTISKGVINYSAVNVTNSGSGNTSLTEEWNQYVFEVTNCPAPSDAFPAILFTFQASGVVYIDDVEIFTGLPTGISASKDAAPFNIINGDGGITFSGLGGQVSVYDITGKRMAQKEVAEGLNHIALARKGMYIVKLNDTVVKVLVK